MRQAIFAIFVCLFPTLTLGQVTFPQVTQPVATFSFEDKDWGIEATTTPTRPPYHARTPTSIPGARVIKTLELKALLDSNKQVVVIDVLDSGTRKSIPGAFWMFGAGDGIFFAAENRRFATALEKLMGGRQEPANRLPLHQLRVLALLQRLAACDRSRIQRRDLVSRRDQRLDWRKFGKDNARTHPMVVRERSEPPVDGTTERQRFLAALGFRRLFIGGWASVLHTIRWS